MAHNSSPANVARTWTDNEAARHHKWTFVFWLSLLLLIASAWFIITRWPRAAVRTFVTTVAVADYGLRLPSPHYPTWDLQTLQKTLQERTLRPWASLTTPSATSAGAMRTWLESLPGTLRGEQIEAIDTLVVHLRGQTKVNLGTDAVKELVLLFGETPGENSRVNELPFKEIVQQLQLLKVQNVILLADFCDLDLAPQLGLVTNPTIEALQELCGSLPESEHQVWIISAKSDNQPALVSHLLKRTLLQSACEFALDPKARFLENASANKSQISLAEFYDRLARYADRASGSKQTPLLLRVGSNQPARPGSTNNSAQTNWTKAQQVTVAHISQELVQAKRKREADQARGDKENKSAAPSESPATNTTASTASASDGSANGPKVATPLDGTLQFWQLRDELESSTPTWSPAQFAPHLWRQLQVDFAQQQFRQSSNSSSTLSRDGSSLLEEIRAVSSAIAGGNSVVGELGRAYREFQNAPNIQRRAWEDPTILSKADQPRWRQLREQYRVYATACVHLPDWIYWCYYHPDMVADLNELVEAIAAAGSKLPRDGSAIESDQRTTFDTSRIVAAQQQLLSKVQAERDLLLKTMNQAQVQLTWSQERILQQLMEFVPLPLADRQALWQRYQKLSVQNVDQPIKTVEESTEQINRGPIDQVLDLAKQNSVQTDWFTTVAKCLQLVDVQDTVKAPLTQIEKLRWGSLFSESLGQAKPTSSIAQNEQLHQWHLGCLKPLAVPSDVPLPTMLAGIVVPASTSQALVVELANEEPPAFRSQSDLTLTLVVKRKDGADVDQCQIAWQFADQTANTLASLKLPSSQCLSIQTDGDAAQRLGTEYKRVSIANKTLRLNCQTAVDTTLLKEQIVIDLKLQEVPVAGKAAAPAETLRIAIRPQQPDVVQLVSNPSNTPQLLIAKASSPALSGSLRALAIKGASSKFEFQLQNLSSEDKRCIVYGHVLPIGALTPAAIQGGSQTTRGTFEKELQNILLVHPDPQLTCDPVELPASSWNLTNPIAVALKKYEGAPAPGANGAAPATTGIPPAGAGKQPDNAKWLVFRIQEVDAENKPKNKSSYFSVFELEALSPAIPEVLSISPANKPTQDGFSLRIEPNRNLWQMFGNSELAIRADVTDAVGTPSSTPPLVRAFAPDASASQLFNLQIDPARTRVDQMLAHLSIGGYPRAVAYHVESGEAKPYPSALAWIDGVEGVASNRPSPVAPSNKRSRSTKNGLNVEEWIYPARDKEGELNYESLQIKSRVDVPAHARVQMRLIDANNANEIARGRILDRDRDFQFTLDALPTGGLSMTATANDLRSVLPAPLDGRMVLQIESIGSSDASRSVLQRQTLVFDRQPPNPARIVPSSNTIVGGKPFSLRIKPTDDLSDVQDVLMAIDEARGEPDVFDPMDTPIPGAADINKEWVFILDSDALVKSQRRSIRVVAMSVDSAGNEQKANVSIVLPIQPAPKGSDPDK